MSSDVMWSPDGKRLAFLVHLREGSQVWTADVTTGKAKPLSESYVMATLAGRPQYRRPADAPSRLLQWMPDGSVLTLLVPPARGPEPATPELPSGPTIRHTREKPTPRYFALKFILAHSQPPCLTSTKSTAQL